MRLLWQSLALAIGLAVGLLLTAAYAHPHAERPHYYLTTP